MAESLVAAEDETTAPPPPLPSTAAVAAESGNPETEVDGFRRRIDDLISQADELEKKVSEVVEFHANKKQTNNLKGNSVVRDKEKERPIGNGSSNNCVNNSGSNSNSKTQGDAGRKEAVCSKRMQELMRQFGTILRQITNHKWAWPFMDPVDVKGLKLHDYYEIIKKPMDFHTIQNQMEAKDDYRYKNVREIYADVRLIFTNAMTYNDEKNDIHQMAKTLLEKFEEKWLQLLPKVVEEVTCWPTCFTIGALCGQETRQKEEEAQTIFNMQSAQEAAIVRLARDTHTELNELNSLLEDLRKSVVQKCRKMSTEEKRKLGVGLSNLSPEDLNKALEIIAQDNPNFQSTAEEVDLDMDAQSESTLWRLKFFVKEALEQQAKNSATKADENSKRKKEICDALAKTAKKRNKKLSS
ncbi:transcription factor GTE6-like isoform X1 [Ananas comosus]|uniref:Transcription factor GTE6-like isoform X1 n=1 Tax=Ananas comosus TaxID=4615 RepID=A0A6P5GDC1_ANACO|nr:transcription factor GTE6-like isoform X1 [Ananas comosus]XP_020106610.1 transcription factor GTE6-like isoform X1 [Ananas comosus]XP_020106611.1 transcription factor GTE6-like isoform X1 [Ananas comosus]